MYARRKPARDRLNPPGGEAQLPRVGQLAIGIEAQECDNDEISLFDIWRILRHHRNLVLGLALVTGLTAGAAALLMTPLYRAEVLLAPVTDLDDNQHLATPMGDFGSLAVLAGIKLDHKDKKEESIATLRSRKFSEQFIEDNNLRPILFYRLWDKQHGRWKTSVSAEDIPTPWDAYKKFSDSVRDVREDRSTGMVTLSVKWRDPAVAAQWANELVVSVNSSLQEKAIDTSNKAIAYLQEQLARTTVVDLQQVLHRLIESEMKKIILANVNTEFAFRVIDPAVVPEEPVWPKAVPMIVLGTLVGLMLGIVAALVLNARRGNVPDPE